MISRPFFARLFSGAPNMRGLLWGSLAALVCLNSASAFMQTPSFSTTWSREGRSGSSVAGRIVMAKEARDVEPILDSSTASLSRRDIPGKLFSAGGGAAALLSIDLSSRIPALAASSAPSADSKSEIPAVQSTKVYQGPTAYGFSFKYPPSWKPSKKGGNRHVYNLETQPKEGSGALLSMTIDQVKFSNISDFGSLDDVAAKVVAEQQKQAKGEKVELSGKKAFSSKRMDYYEISTKSEKFERVSKFAATAEQLFVFTATLPLSRADEFREALETSVSTFSVRPNYMENFQKYGTNQAPEALEALKKLPGDFVRVENFEF